MSEDMCLKTLSVSRPLSSDNTCLETAVFRQYLSGDSSRLQTLVSRHITSGNTRLKIVYVLRVYISAPRTPLTFQSAFCQYVQSIDPFLLLLPNPCSLTFKGETSATGTTIGENIRREMGIASLDSMKDTPTISLRFF
jgi:hypothetical protein